MTPDDISRIFGIPEGGVIWLDGGAWITAENFLQVFSEAPDRPTMEDLLAIDNGEKGYEFLIRNGNYAE